MAALEESLAAVKGEPLGAGSKPDGRRRRRLEGARAPRRAQVQLAIQDQEPAAIAKQGQSREVEVDGRQLALTNLDKVSGPTTGFTKGEVIDYYARIADTMLPHLPAGR